MAFTQTDIDKLKAAIGTGARKVRYSDGREVEYRTLAEMREVLTMMQADVSSSSGSGAVRSFTAGF